MLQKVFQGRSTSYLAAEVLLQPWIWTVCTECGPDGLIFVPHFVNIAQCCPTYCYVRTGKSRYGICVNFYRPMERVPPGGCLGGARGDRHSSTFRRESWRKSIEKSSDSAFSRLVTHPVQRLAGQCFPLNYKYYTVFVVRQMVKKNISAQHHLLVQPFVFLWVGRSCDRPPRHRFFLVSLCL